MTVQQEYFTSYSNELTNFVGWGVKATSPGLTEEMKLTLDPLLGYKVPPSLSGQPVGTHPVALRYQTHKLYGSIFLCSQSIGVDANNRPGNYFAHALIIDNHDFATNPPIFYWKSDFWKSADPVTRPQIASLDPLPSFDVPPTFDYNAIWEFLNQEGRREWLYKLLRAVIDYGTSYKRILILDSTENVVLWLACISFLLPEAYRPFLSFSTYSHPPLFPHFMVSGITNDWLHDAYRNEQSYAIFNLQDGRYTPVPDSYYADFITQVARPELLETELLPLLTDYTRRFPRPVAIDRSLDRMMLYANIQRRWGGQGIETLSGDAVSAIQQALNSFEGLAQLEADDVKELLKLQTVLEDVPRSEQTRQMDDAQRRVKLLLKKVPKKEVKRQQQEEQAIAVVETPSNHSQQQIPTEDYYKAREWNQVDNVVRVPNDPPYTPTISTPPSPIVPTSSDPNVRHPKADDISARIIEAAEDNKRIALINLVHEFGNENRQIVETRYNELRETFKDDDQALAQFINQSKILRELEEKCERGTTRFFIDFWECLGALLYAEQKSDNIIQLTVKEAIRQKRNEPALGDALLDAMCLSTRGLKQVEKSRWLLLHINNSFHEFGIVDEPLRFTILKSVYEKCSEALSFEQHETLRKFMHSLYANHAGFSFEPPSLEYELSRTDLINIPGVIEARVKQARENKGNAKNILQRGLRYLKKQCDIQQWLGFVYFELSLQNSEILGVSKEEFELAILPLFLSMISLSLDPLLKNAPDAPFALLTIDERAPGSRLSRFLELYLKYRHSEGLSFNTRATLEAILALIEGEMNDSIMKSIQEQVRILLPYEYKSGVRRFIHEFITLEINSPTHLLLIQAFFMREYHYNTYFWQAYEEALQRLIPAPEELRKTESMELAVKRLADWFSYTPDDFPKQSYILQEFFLRLPAIYQKVWQHSSRDTTIFATFVSIAAAEPWYAIMKLYLPGQIEAVRGLDNDEKQPIPQRAAVLFERRSELQKHRNWLPNAQMEESSPAFWTYYWMNFESLLLRDAELTLDLLNFWFDASFKHGVGTMYLPQQFFMGLPQALKEASLKQGFNSIVQKMEKVAFAKKYPWFPVVQPFFHI